MSNTTPIPTVEETPKPWISDGVYNLLRSNVEIVLPALAVFYSALALLWGWPFSEQITGTFAAIVLLFGAIIKANQKRGRAVAEAEVAADKAVLEQKIVDVAAIAGADPVGDLVLNTGDEGAGLLTIQLESPPETFENEEEVRLRIVRLHDNGMG